MENTLQRRSLTGKVRQKLLLLLSLVCFSQAAIGQIKPPVMNPEWTFPGTWGTSTVTNSHCYSRFGNFAGCPPPAGANVGLLVSCYELAGVVGFGWQVVDWNTWVIYESGTITLPAGATDPNVGIINAGPTGEQIDVSYYLSAGAASGHYVDVYDWNAPAAWCGGPGGIAFNFSNQLSCIPTYTRISMDSHKGYGTAIVWEDPTGGTNEIHVVAANNNNFGPPQRIAGTAGHLSPEVAFVHPAGPLEIHVVSYDPAFGNIEEYFFNWMDIIPGGIFACPPPGLCNACGALLGRAVMDVNAVGAATPNSLHIDAPDHYNGQNWAYTWELGSDIFARIYNPNLPPWPAPAVAAVPATVCFTNGSYVAPFYPGCCPMPTINATTAINNDVPVICWDQNWQPVGPINQQSFYVAWHTTYRDVVVPYNPTSDAYIGIQVNEDGLIRNPMPMPFNWLGASNVPGNISPTPTIALSEGNENVRMYTTFSEFNGGNYMRNRMPPWNANTLKPGSSQPDNEALEIKINPNPFKDKLWLDIPHEMENEHLKIRVTDMAGREMGSYDNIADAANDYMANVGRKLVPGTYNISVECTKIQFQKVFKVTKLD